MRDRPACPEVGVALSPVGSVGAVVSAGVAVVITSCGLFVASRDWKSIPSVEVPASTKLYPPLPDTRDVTLKSTQPPEGTEPLSSTPEPTRAVLLAHVIAVSDQVLAVV